MQKNNRSTLLSEVNLEAHAEAGTETNLFCKLVSESDFVASEKL